MADKRYQWHQVAAQAAELGWNANHIAVVAIGDKKICMTRYQQGWYAFAYICPHASGIMAEGYIDVQGQVVCPVHRYKFSLQNGRNTSGEGYYLKTYPVEIREEAVFIGVPV